MASGSPCPVLAVPLYRINAEVRKAKSTQKNRVHGGKSAKLKLQKKSAKAQAQEGSTWECKSTSTKTIIKRVSSSAFLTVHHSGGRGE
jgi:hypothetical protein